MTEAKLRKMKMGELKEFLRTNDIKYKRTALKRELIKLALKNLKQAGKNTSSAAVK